MNEQIICAGFGGQGVMLLGKLLAQAGMRSGYNVTWMPSYGAEVRGGTAHSMIHISDSGIASPTVSNPTTCIVMNKPSLIKFEPRLMKGGTLLYNSSLIDIEPSRKDLRCIPVAANQLAEQEGSSRSANMIMLGLLAKIKPEVASLDSIQATLERAVSARHRNLNEINKRCLARGFSLNGE